MQNIRTVITTIWLVTLGGQAAFSIANGVRFLAASGDDTSPIPEGVRDAVIYSGVLDFALFVFAVIALVQVKALWGVIAIYGLRLIEAMQYGLIINGDTIFQIGGVIAMTGALLYWAHAATFERSVEPSQTEASE